MTDATTDAESGEGSDSVVPEEPLEVYAMPLCTHCKNVKTVLDRMEIDYVTHSVPRSKDERPDVEEISGQRGVPVLVDPNTGVEGMVESTDIIEYLRETYEYPDGVEPKSGLVSRMVSNVL